MKVLGFYMFSPCLHEFSPSRTSQENSFATNNCKSVQCALKWKTPLILMVHHSLEKCANVCVCVHDNNFPALSAFLTYLCCAKKTQQDKNGQIFKLLCLLRRVRGGEKTYCEARFFFKNKKHLKSCVSYWLFLSRWNQYSYQFHPQDVKYSITRL